MELRYLNEKLQWFDGANWVDVPVVVASAEPVQCPDCGEFHTGNHVCWVKLAKG